MADQQEKHSASNQQSTQNTERPRRRIATGMKKYAAFPGGALTDFGFQKRGVGWVRAPARACACALSRAALRATPGARSTTPKNKWGWLLHRDARVRAARRYLAAKSKCLAQSNKSPEGPSN